MKTYAGYQPKYLPYVLRPLVLPLVLPVPSVANRKKPCTAVWIEMLLPYTCIGSKLPSSVSAMYADYNISETERLRVYNL